MNEIEILKAENLYLVNEMLAYTDLATALNRELSDAFEHAQYFDDDTERLNCLKAIIDKFNNPSWGAR
jgi:hypothetical protein